MERLFDAHHPLRLADQGCFFVGGAYDEAGTMSGQVFVQYQVPADVRHDSPVLLIHGGGQTGAGFLSTPDGRNGWADYFLVHGFAVYVLDAAGRGRSQGHAPSGRTRTAEAVARRVSDTVRAPEWPQAALHTRWPGAGVPGERTFDQFYASQVSSHVDAATTELAMRAAGAELLDTIGHATLVAHSQGASFAWQIADARPDLVDAVVAVEPSGPPVANVSWRAGSGFVDTGRPRPWGLTAAPLTYEPPAGDPSELAFEHHVPASTSDLAPHWLQSEPARRLPRLATTRIAVISGDASYHAPYDAATSAYLTQAGVPHDHVVLADLGIHGNGHMLNLESNSLEVAAVIADWITRGAP